MSFMPDEIETMKQIAANLEKCASIMGQQIVFKDGKMVLQKEALNNIYRAIAFNITVSKIPIEQYADILRRLFWDKPETAKRIKEQYCEIACFAPIKWQKFDEAKQLTGVICLQSGTEQLAKEFRVCAEMAQRDITPETPAETGQRSKADKKSTPEIDPSLIYQSDAALFYNIPKSLLSKSAAKEPGEPGYLWSDVNGRRRFYRKADLERISRSRQKLRGI